MDNLWTSGNIPVYSRIKFMQPGDYPKQAPFQTYIHNLPDIALKKSYHFNKKIIKFPEINPFRLLYFGLIKSRRILNLGRKVTVK
ncbi:hypothetical protein SAMN05444280_11957 [Tangfeifania diversioriginum]|uniref:Uncharacterized protein n=1 Tax=Tangfeifania diversioriginum TaxID=1168035 RepID=A0A1M6JA09_9BACT|nr:hypothetical protein SAMN05444280_11957 [Tangfeifania diversioriginum]